MIARFNISLIPRLCERSYQYNGEIIKHILELKTTNHLQEFITDRVSCIREHNDTKH
jgi:hypothetical protein